jgi:hypothetical protein
VAAVGAGVGAVLGGPIGAGLGGLLGGALGTSKLPLEQAVVQLLTARSLGLASLERLSRNRCRLLFTDASGGYWTVESRVNAASTTDQDAVEDALYDALAAQLDQWSSAHAA